MPFIAAQRNCIICNAFSVHYFDKPHLSHFKDRMLKNENDIVCILECHAIAIAIKVNIHYCLLIIVYR